MKKIGKVLFTIGIAISQLGCSNSSTTSNEANANLQTTQNQTTENVVSSKSLSLEESSIETVTLYDQDGIQIIAESLDFSGYAPALNYEFVNNSSNEVKITTEGRIIVNHFMMIGYVGETIEAGKKAKTEMNFHRDELALAGITQINDIQVNFAIQIGDDWQNPIETGYLEIQTSSYGNEDRTYTMTDLMQGIVSNDDSPATGKYVDDSIVFNQNGITIDTIAYARSNYDKDYILIHIKNDSNQTINFGSYDVQINDVTLTSYLWSSVDIASGCDAIEEYPIDYFINDGATLLMSEEDVGKVSFTGVIQDLDYNELGSQKIDFNIKNYSVNTDGETIYEDDTVAIIYKGNMTDNFDGIHFACLVTNKSSNIIKADVEYNSMYINGYSTTDYTGSALIEPQKYGLLDVDISSLYFEDSGITSIDDVETVEFAITIDDENGYEIETIPVTMNFTNK